jgi:hypothetical protein
MRTVLALITLTIAAAAQDSPAVAAAKAACGPKDVNFDVQRDRSYHSFMQPEAGKALLYVIQEYGQGWCLGASCITKVAVDAAWVGANRSYSYFPFAVEPGERHLCAAAQSGVPTRVRSVGLAHFTAEAGKSYFFRIRTLAESSGRSLDLEPIDSDLGKFLIAAYPLSIWHPKK